MGRIAISNSNKMRLYIYIVLRRTVRFIPDDEKEKKREGVGREDWGMATSSYADFHTNKRLLSYKEPWMNDM